MAFGWFKKKDPETDAPPEEDPASQPVEAASEPEAETPDSPGAA